VPSADSIIFEEVSKRFRCVREELDVLLEGAIFLLPFLSTASGTTELSTWRRPQINNYKSHKNSPMKTKHGSTAYFATPT
jgi:hypothetical protein